MTDQDFLKLAVKKGNEVAKPHNFGAVVVKNEKVIASEINHVHEQNDPTLHAETSAIHAACKKLGNYNLEGCTLYGSHQPCLMCFNCAAWSRIDRIVCAEPASDSGFSYEFEQLSLRDLTNKLARPMKVELIRITHENV